MLVTEVLELVDRMHEAASKLSASIRPGKGGLIHIQELLLMASWLQSTGKYKEAWHILSKAIREENEIGIFSVRAVEIDLYEANAMKVFTNFPRRRTCRDSTSKREDARGLSRACGICK